MRVRLHNRACTTRRTRQIITRHSIQIGQNTSNAFLRILRSPRQICRFSRAYFIRTSDRNVSNGIPTILIIFRYTIFRCQFTTIITMQLLTYSCGFRFHVLRFSLYHTRILRGECVHASSRLLTGDLDRFGSTSCRRCVCILKESIRRGVSCVSACSVTFRSRLVNHF